MCVSTFVTFSRPKQSRFFLFPPPLLLVLAVHTTPLASCPRLIASRVVLVAVYAWACDVCVRRVCVKVLPFGPNPPKSHVLFYRITDSLLAYKEKSKPAFLSGRLLDVHAFYASVSQRVSGDSWGWLFRALPSVCYGSVFSCGGIVRRVGEAVAKKKNWEHGTLAHVRKRNIFGGAWRLHVMRRGLAALRGGASSRPLMLFLRLLCPSVRVFAFGEQLSLSSLFCCWRHCAASRFCSALFSC